MQSATKRTVKLATRAIATIVPRDRLWWSKHGRIALAITTPSNIGRLSEPVRSVACFGFSAGDAAGEWRRTRGYRVGLDRQDRLVVRCVNTLNSADSIRRTS